MVSAASYYHATLPKTIQSSRNVHRAFVDEIKGVLEPIDTETKSFPIHVPVRTSNLQVREIRSEFCSRSLVVGEILPPMPFRFGYHTGCLVCIELVHVFLRWANLGDAELICVVASQWKVRWNTEGDYFATRKVKELCWDSYQRRSDTGLLVEAIVVQRPHTVAVDWKRAMCGHDGHGFDRVQAWKRDIEMIWREKGRRILG